MSVVFYHEVVGRLALRLNPTSVQWTYNLIHHVEKTFAGEVVQLLGVNIDKLIIEGRFGREGPHGRKLQSFTNRLGRNEVGLLERPRDEYWDYSHAGQFATGLSQMYQWFWDYFAVATQEGDFDERPVKLTYDGAGFPASWSVYPTSFPSFKRSNEDFAPEWRVICEVEEADTLAESRSVEEALNALRDETGTAPDRFVQPPDNGIELSLHGLDEFRKMLPQFSDAELNKLIMFNASFPWYATGQASAPEPVQGVAVGGTGVSSPDGAVAQSSNVTNGAQAMQAAIRIARQMGLDVSENPAVGGVDLGEHTTGSFHGQTFPGTNIGKGLDVHGSNHSQVTYNPQLVAYAEALYNDPGIRPWLSELFYNHWGNYDPQSGHGKISTPVDNNHWNHVHVSISDVNFGGQFGA